MRFWRRVSLKDFMSKCFLLLICVVLLLGCAGVSPVANSTMERTPPSAQRADLEAEEYAVYSALIESMYIDGETESVVILDHTRLDELKPERLDASLRFVRENMPNSVSKEVFDNLRAKNDQPYTLGNHFNIRVKSVLLSKEEVDKILNTSNGWSEFFKKYPRQGIITFSRVGLNKDMRQALVYTSIQSGGKSGEGYYILLNKENGNWTIKNKVEVWVS